MKKFKIAAAQVAPVFLNKTKTVEKAIAIMGEAAKHGAQMVVFPEAFIAGYPDWVWTVAGSDGTTLNKLYKEIVKHAVSVPDESTEALCSAAKKFNIHVVIGMNERNTESSNASLFNSVLFIDNKGKIIGKHRKLIPTGGERLVWGQGDGSTLKVLDTSLGKVGGLICWENLMPLARTSLYHQGMQILVSPTWDKSQQWQNSMQHIAREGGTYVVSVCTAIKVDDIPDTFEFRNNYPEGRVWINAGNSCIVAPTGKIIAGPLENEEGLLYADVDLDSIIEAKRMFDVAGHYSRPDVFDLSNKSI